MINEHEWKWIDALCGMGMAFARIEYACKLCVIQAGQARGI